MRHRLTVWVIRLLMRVAGADGISAAQGFNDDFLTVTLWFRKKS